MLQIGHYQVLEELNRSPGSTIFRVSDSQGNKYIAKLQTSEHPDLLDSASFEREFHFLRRVSSPYVIKAIELIKVEHRLAIILEDIDGIDLNEHLTRVGSIPMQRFFQYAQKIAQGLQSIHASRLIHRDINPRNIVINEARELLQIIDLGIASELSLEKSQIKEANEFKGSLPYISPEQTGRMNRNLDYRTDFYSLGMTFHQMLTGHPAFQFQDKVAYFHAHIAREPDFISDVNPDVPVVISSIVRKLVQKNAEDRYQSSFGLSEDLKLCEQAFGSEGKIKDFPLGTSDLLDRFELRSAVYGREAELDQLLRVFDRVNDGANAVVLVSGYSGIGKSSLIQEIHKPVTTLKAIYAEGKFSQSDSQQPFSALEKALTKIIQQILASSVERCEAFGMELRKRLGSNCTLLAQILPLAHTLVGEHGESSLDGAQKLQASLMALRDFAAAICHQHQSLVLFLDDLQWADINTIRFIEMVLLKSPINHFMLIGSYRSNEVSVAHPLSGLIVELRKAGKLHEIHLDPLPPSVVQKLVANTLHADVKSVDKLADIIVKKSQGNPFFIEQLMKTLRSEGSIYFNYELRKWEWDLTRATNINISGDLAEFIKNKLRSLSPRLSNILMHAAVWGHDFTVGDLADELDESPRKIAEQLWPAVEEGILLAKSNNAQFLRYADSIDRESERFSELIYGFQHDKIQQAAYEYSSDEDRAQIHLRVARSLAKSTTRSVSKIELVRHYMSALHLVLSESEQLSILEYSLQAIDEAKRASAYETAYQIVVLAKDILMNLKIESDNDIGFRLNIEHFELGFLCGKANDSEAIYADLIKSVKSEVQRLRLYEIRTCDMIVQSRYHDAISLGVATLAIIGIRLEANPSKLRVMREFAWHKLIMRKRRIAELIDLPLMEDVRYLGIMRILTHMMTAAQNLGRRNLLACAVFIRFRIFLSHGIPPSGPGVMMSLAVIIGSSFSRLKEGAQYALVGLAMHKKHGNRVDLSRLLPYYVLNVQVWTAHHRQYRDYFKLLERESIQVANFFWAATAAICGLYCPEDLRRSEVLEQAKDSLDLIKLANSVVLLDSFNLYVLFWDRLEKTNTNKLRFIEHFTKFYQIDSDQGNSSHEGDFDKEKLLAAIEMRRNRVGLVYYCVLEMKIACMMGHYAECMEFIEKGGSHLSAAPILKLAHEFVFFKSLAFAHVASTKSGIERALCIKQFRQGLGYFKRFSSHHPVNHRHFVTMLEVEQAKIKNLPLNLVINLYDKAIDEAENFSDFWGAFASAQAAEWYDRTHSTRITQKYAQESCYLYHRIGATGMIEFLQEKYGLAKDNAINQNATMHTMTFGYSRTQQLATQAPIVYEELFRSVQVISNESSLDKMLIRFVKILVEFSGAEKTMLVLKDPDNGGLYMAVDYVLSQKDSVGWSYVPLTGIGCPMRLVQMVEMTRKSILLDAACEQGDFADNSYIRDEKVLSVLCCPVLRGGELVAIFYLENNRIRGAFTSQQEEMLRVVAHQVSSVIHSAILQQSLEKKVRQKTRDLSIVMQHLKQGIFTVGRDATIQEGYSQYLRTLFETTEIYGKSPLDLLFRNSSITRDQQLQMQTVLAMVGENVLNFLLNSEHMIREYSRTSRNGAVKVLQLDWEVILEEETIERFMVTVRDVTEFRQIEEEAKRQKGELEILAILLSKGKRVISNSLADFKSLNLLIDKAYKAIGSHPTIDNLNYIFRQLHTQKGLSRLMSYQSLSSEIHQLESATQDLIAKKISFREFSLVFTEQEQKIGRMISAMDDCLKKFYQETDSSRPDQALLNYMRTCLSKIGGNESVKRELGMAIDSLDSLPLSSLALEVRDGLVESAQKQNKAPPRVNLSCENVTVSAKFIGSLKGILTHIFQNSLDHGLEDISTRELLRKNPQGEIQVITAPTTSGFMLEIFDDGQGLNLARIAEKAMNVGLIESSKQDDRLICRQIFEAGFSTCDIVTESSGRGVGMDAVKELVQEMGGSLEVKFRGPRQNDFRPFSFVMTFPQGVLGETIDLEATVERTAS